MNRKSTLTYILSALFLCCGAASTLSAQASQERFVLAPSGLNLRTSSDPSSAKVATVPFGASVTLAKEAQGPELTVDNLKGNMVKVDAGGKSGYMFSGYLSQYPAPAPRMDVAKYVTLARDHQCDIYHESHNYDYDGYFRVEEGITLLNASWEEAFVVARILGEIPPKLKFPAATKMREESFVNPDKDDNAWSDQLDVTRDEDFDLLTISYYWRGEGSGRFVNIKPAEGANAFLIMVGGIAD